MAEEAFALSPISARAALPGEEDYAAISEAFMETSRGRWFLGEYAKRNRNADTRMVLDAVARIEESLAAQKQPALDTRLADALAAIRQTLGDAQDSAVAALDGMALDQHLAPVRKGARVIREIAWRLREIGADGRICDILDSQVTAIEAGAAQISSAEARAVVEAAFASVADRLADFDAGESHTARAKPPEPSRVVPFPSPPEEASSGESATAETVAPGPAVPEIEIEAPVSIVAPAVETMPTSTAATEAVDAAAEHDEAVLDLIAAEMAAPDPMADDFEIVMPEPVAETITSVPLLAEPEAAQAPPLPAPEPAMEESLGSSLIASGMLRKPAPANDPLAPIRRMSQAEKIAFVS